MLELHKTIRVLHVVIWPTVFISFYDRYWQEGVFKVIQNHHFLVFLAVWVLPTRFWAGEGVAYIRIRIP